MINKIHDASLDFTQIKPSDFETNLNEEISPLIKQIIDESDLQIAKISNTERDNCILKILNAIRDPKLRTAGIHRHQDWESGWTQNLNSLEDESLTTPLLPRYFGKSEYVRWRKDFVKGKPGHDYRVLDILVHWMLEKYMKNLESIYEFGCGPGHHLKAARFINEHANITGLDWAKSSQLIISKISDKGIIKNISGKYFDFFNPDYSIDIPRDSGFYTVAALEQVGQNFEPFLDFVLAKKPLICAHIEPIEELLEPDNLIDCLSMWYFQKRKYLSGFLTRLRSLEKEGRIQIHKEQRSYTGSLFIEGHSIVIWSPTQ